MPAREHFWTGRSLTVIGLLGFALLLAGARLADPTRGNNGNSSADVADVSAHPAAFFVSTVLVLASTISVSTTVVPRS